MTETISAEGSLYPLRSRQEHSRRFERGAEPTRIKFRFRNESHVSVVPPGELLERENRTKTERSSLSLSLSTSTLTMRALFELHANFSEHQLPSADVSLPHVRTSHEEKPTLVNPACARLAAGEACIVLSPGHAHACPRNFFVRMCRLGSRDTLLPLVIFGRGHGGS